MSINKITVGTIKAAHAAYDSTHVEEWPEAIQALDEMEAASAGLHWGERVELPRWVHSDRLGVAVFIRSIAREAMG